MKSILKPAFWLILWIFVLAACGRKPDGIVFSGYAYSPEKDPDVILTSDDLRAEMQETYQRMLAYFDASEEDLSGLPEEYAGYYMNINKPATEKARLTIMLTKHTQEVEEVFRKACGEDAVDFASATYSFRELQDALKAVRETKSADGRSIAISAWINMRFNQVTAIVRESDFEVLPDLRRKHPCIVPDYAFGTLKKTEDRQYETMKGIHIGLDDPVISTDTENISIPVVNQTDEQMTIRIPFILEMKVGEEWYEIPKNRDLQYMTIEGTIKAHDESNCFLQSHAWNFAFVEGDYRIIQPYALGWHETMQYAAVWEFRMEEDPPEVMPAIEKQKTTKHRAEKDGAVVIGGNMERNYDRIRRFLHNIRHYRTDSLRIVAILLRNSGLRVTVYENDTKSVYWYAYLDIVDDTLVLTDWSDTEEAMKRGLISEKDVTWVISLSPELARDLQEEMQQALPVFLPSRQVENLSQRVILKRGICTAELSFRDPALTDETEDRETAFCEIGIRDGSSYESIFNAETEAGIPKKLKQIDERTIEIQFGESAAKEIYEAKDYIRR